MLHSDASLIFTDRRGWPRIPGLHDAALVTLSVAFGKRVIFSARGMGGELTTLVLDDLQLLRVDDLWEGVVLDSVAIWRVVETAGEDGGEDCRRAWRALLAGRVPEDSRASEIARLSRAHDGSVLVAVSSSYGGEFQALCRRVTIDGRAVAPV